MMTLARRGAMVPAAMRGKLTASGTVRASAVRLPVDAASFRRTPTSRSLKKSLLFLTCRRSVACQAPEQWPLFARPPDSHQEAGFCRETGTS